MAAPAVELDAQYRAIREEAALVERPEPSLIAVTGAEAAEYLQGQVTNDVEALDAGAGCYAALLDRKGHIESDLRVLRTAPDGYLLLTEPEPGPALLRHLQTYKIGREVEVAQPEAAAMLSLLGPRSGQVAGIEAPGPEHAHREASTGGVSFRAIATADGLDLLCAPEHAEALRAALLDGGAEAASEAAAEIVRVEAGRPRYAGELAGGPMPAEAGIVERAVAFDKGCYIGQEPVARLHYRGRPNRVLRGLTLSAPSEPGAAIRLDGRELGTIGTAVVSPALGPIALAIVRREAEPGATVEVDGGITAQVADLPFRP